MMNEMYTLMVGVLSLALLILDSLLNFLAVNHALGVFLL